MLIFTLTYRLHKESEKHSRRVARRENSLTSILVLLGATTTHNIDWDSIFSQSKSNKSESKVQVNSPILKSKL